jgi:phosphoribosylformylglycinamidine cyclo-ligase
VRKIIDAKGFTPTDEAPPLPGRLIDYLLDPTSIYVRTVLELIEDFDIRGIVNITGGGITGNVPRILPGGLSANVDRSAWTPPKIFSALQEWGRVTQEEMFRVFNMGIGMVLIVAAAQAGEVMAWLENRNVPAATVGKIISGNNKVVYTDSAG